MVGRSLSVRHIHIDPDAGYDMALIRRIPGQLQQDPADLAPVHIYVVRPLQPGLRQPHSAQCLHDGQANHQTHARQLPSTTVHLERQAAIQVLPERTHPVPPTPPPSGRLRLGNYQERSPTSRQKP